MITNIATPNKSRKLLRQERAASRLQTYPAHQTATWDSEAQAIVERKLAEFKGLCRSRAFSEVNIYGVALNVLAPYAKAMGVANHQHWLARFTAEGTRAWYRTAELPNHR